MTVGLMSIQKLQLQVMQINGNDQQKQYARRILRTVENHHLFLVTLLIANAIALQSLPIVIHTLVPAWLAILISTFIVLLVAEIFPMAYCTGPNKIKIAYHASPFIQGMIVVLFVVAFPISKGLDYLLGVHPDQRIKHKDFANLVKGETQSLKKSEILLLTSILELRCMRVADIMITTTQLYMLSITDKLTKSKIDEMKKKQFSYILIYKEKKNNIVGFIKAKQLAIKYLKNGSKPLVVKDIYKANSFITVYADTNLLEMLMLFQAKSIRIALVSTIKKKIVPNMQSIMYSKTDMIMSNIECQVQGAVFLYSIFEQITNFNQKIQHKYQSHDNSQNEQKQMTQLKRPLINS